MYVPVYENLFKNRKVEEFDEVFFEFLNQNKLTKFNLIGHSMGGGLAIKFAADHQDKINKLYLIDSVGIPISVSFLQTALHFLSNSLRATKTILVDAGLIPRLVINWHILLKLVLFGYTADLKNEMQKIKTDTFIFWGEKDIVVPLENAKKMNKLILKSELIVLKNMDHNWILKCPEKFWDATS